MNIEQNIPLHDKNWFQTGGPARFFCKPSTHEEFQEALAFGRNHNLPIFVLGKGANILVSDDGFKGLVINPQLTAIEKISKNSVRAQAGCTVSDLIDWCLDNAMIGLEEFSGIPGTVGGAIYINLHYFEFFISNFLDKATVISKETGQIMEVTPDWFAFGYNTTRLHNHDYFLLDATFNLTSADPFLVAFTRGRSKEIIRQRRRRYPTSHTCGSFFRNLHPHEIPHNKTVPYIAYYLDKVGIKGELSFGCAKVSHHHANMLVHTGEAKTSDIISLACLMQEKVYREFGIVPEPECLLIGFDTYPLLTKQTCTQISTEKIGNTQIPEL